jgi:peptidoglycan/xylan/chitin deacetylase (PgdA/CDA1 family)
MRGMALAAAALTRLGVPGAAAAARRFGLWRGGELMVVLYHRVVDPRDVGDLDPDLIDATPADFDAQMGALAQRFRPVSIDEVLAAHRAGRPVPAGSVLVTFDDGYRDNFEHAFPILKRHGIPGLFFISTGHVDGRRLFWWEQLSLFVRRSPLERAVLEYPRRRELNLSSPASRAAVIRGLNRTVKDIYGLDVDRFVREVAQACQVPWTQADAAALADPLLMTWDQVREMRRAGMGIGSHTHTHRVLNTLAASDLDQELRGSRAILEERLGEPVTTIAYPVGKSIAGLPWVKQALAGAGYELGFTTTPGTNRIGQGDDPYDLRRLPIDRGLPAPVAQMYLSFPALAR